ncbi:MAG: MASE3 domain-containing protein [Spirochaetaceae bacterium]
MAAALIALYAFYLLSLHHFLLFHFTAELFSIGVASSVFALTWAARRRIEEGGVLLIGISYLFVALVDLLHTLSYEGTGLFPGYGSNLPTQLWLIARYIEVASLFLGLHLLGRRVNYRSVTAVYAAVTVVLVASVIPLRVFPQAYVDGQGLTAFKIGSEYLLSGILIGLCVRLWMTRGRYEAHSFRWLLAAIASTALSEILFTFYIGVYDLSNLLGHLLKIVSFFAVYKAVVERAVYRPDALFYRRLAEREQELEAALHQRNVLFSEMRHRVKNDMMLIQAFLSLQAAGTSNEEVKHALAEAHRRVAALSRIYQTVYDRDESQPLDLAATVQDTVRQVREALGTQRVRIRESIEEVTAPTRIVVASALITNELLTNTLKYAFVPADGVGAPGTEVEKGPVPGTAAPGTAAAGTEVEKTEPPEARAEVSIRRASEHTVEVIVRDNGRGYPREVIAGGQEGYGLAIVTALAHQHGGSASFYNDNGAVASVALSTE